jgi:hypothetical protein
MPAIELSCDTSTGVGCVNPPPGALFYPLYTTTKRDGKCWWQFGGAKIPGTTNTLGGNSATEFAQLAPSVYITGQASIRVPPHSLRTSIVCYPIILVLRRQTNGRLRGSRLRDLAAKETLIEFSVFHSRADRGPTRWKLSGSREHCGERRN